MLSFSVSDSMELVYFWMQNITGGDFVGTGNGQKWQGVENYNRNKFNH